MQKCDHNNIAIKNSKNSNPKRFDMWGTKSHSKGQTQNINTHKLKQVNQQAILE